MPSPISCTLTDDEIRARTLEVFGKRPCSFQIRVCRAQLERRNVISIAPTGSGKTLSYLMTLAFSDDSIIILVTALNVLGDQFVREAESAGFRVIFVHAENDNDKTFTDIRQLNYRVVVMTPGVLVRRGGRCATMLWPNKAFTSKLQNTIFDEGHCIVQWGDTFRPEYSEAADILWLLPDLSICLSSATMSPPMVTALVEKFRFGKNYTLFHRSNDRVNIAYTVVKMKHPANSYEDLGFLVPKDWKEGDPVPPKFMVFFDSKKEAEAASRYLASRVSLALRCKIPWFHAGMTAFFRVEEVERFSNGETWGLAATDSGGMGLDIPDVQIVVQWKAPADLNTVAQRFGRGARDPSLQAVAILIAEPNCFYEVKVEKRRRKEQRRLREGQKQGGRKKRRVDVPEAPQPRPLETEAEVLDALNEESDSDSDGEDETGEYGDDVPQVGTVAGDRAGDSARSPSNQASVVEDARAQVSEETVESVLLEDEEQTRKRKGKKQSRRSKPPGRALCFFMNAHALSGPKRCRRYHTNLYFANDTAPPDSEDCCERCAPRPPAICCDLCCPSEVAAMIPVRNDSAPKTKWAPAQAKIAPYTAGAREDALERDLHQWRDDTARSLHGDYDLYGPDSFLHFKIIRRIVDLAHARELESVRDLEVHTKWCLARRHGEDILRIVQRHFPKQVPQSPFVTTPLTCRSRENQLPDPASRPLPQSPLATRPKRALPTCSVCGILGHRKNNLLCRSKQQALASTGLENTPPEA